MSVSFIGKIYKVQLADYKLINPYTQRNENILLNIITPVLVKVNSKYRVLM